MAGAGEGLGTVAVSGAMFGESRATRHGPGRRGNELPKVARPPAQPRRSAAGKLGRGVVR